MIDTISDVKVNLPPNRDVCAYVEAMDEALQDAARAAGGIRALSRKLGTSHQAVAQWDRAPASRVLEIERYTGVSRHRLRPDLYPVEENGSRLTDLPQMLTLDALGDFAPDVKHDVAMTPETLRRAVEEATDEALRQFIEESPELIIEQWRKNVRTRLAALLYRKLRRSMK
jgi:DNA-binding transcriptional regulator YdaS (Cro superfamily)